MTDPTIRNPAYRSLTDHQLSEIDELCDRFDQELLNGHAPRMEAFQAEAPEAAQDGLLAELLAMEREYRTTQGETPRPDDYVQRFPQQAVVIAGVFSGAASPHSSGDRTILSDSQTATSAEVPTQSALSHPPEQAATGETLSTGPLSTVMDVGGQLGPYKLLAKLGEGGMGAVYQARHTKLGKLVALKILPQHLLSRSDALSRFEREMLAVGSLQHPNIIQALDAGEISGVHYLSMEYVEGQDLQQFIQTKGKMSVVNACKAIRQAAQGLAAAHQLGLVHRDIKPSNLFVTKQTGQIKILDMGLALLAQEETLAALTTTGECFGTPDYMAPEQWNDAHTCDARSDLYSLGCTLYFLLIGRPPYHSDTHRSAANKMKGHVLDAIPDLALARPDVPAGVVAIYLKLMAKTPSDRFASADELATALAPWAKALPAPSATAAAPTEPVIRPSSPERAQSSGTLKASPSAAPSAPKIQAVATPLTGQGSPPRRPLSRWLLAAGGAAAFVLLGVIIITITNRDGTNTEIKVPDTSQVEVTKPGDNPPATAKPSWHGWPADAPPPAIAPFDAAQANKHQEAWAKYLGVPVEFTNTIGMKLRLIPPGEFTMGGTAEEIAAAIKDAGDNKYWQEFIPSETPQHKVILTQPIYLGVNEVTQAEYEQVMGVNPSDFAPMGMSKEAVAGLETAEHPVEMVSWNDAAEFCAKLSKQEKLKPFYFRAGETITPLDGTGYRLPSEAKWEFACRAGTTSKYWIGDKDEDLVRAGWFGGNSGGRTHTAGELQANPFGLYDIHGNAWEWVQDGWDATWYGQFSEKPAVNPSIPFSAGSQRVLRGGNWHDTASGCRSPFRHAYDPTSRHFIIGFRLSLPVDAVKAAMAERIPPARSSNTSKTGWNGWPAEAPQPAIAPFDAAQANKHQAAWAAYLKVPVEFTNSIGMKFRLIPPGEFLMVSTPEFAATLKDVSPDDMVILTQPIYLGVNEVTQAEYEKVMGVNPSHFAPMGMGRESVAGLKTTDHPVEMVSWNDAAEFCTKLSQQEKLKPFYFREGDTIAPLDGTGYRLPSEAEWEFACRAGTPTKFWIGDKDQDLMQAGWFRGNSEGRTHAAGELKANPFGLADMHGNVWEWVQDGWDGTFDGQFPDKPAINPNVPFHDCPQRMLRGGHWEDSASNCRSSNRIANVPTNRNLNLGFRVSLVVDTVKQSRDKQP